MATIKDVAKAAGVSVTAVSAALNSNGRVSKDTRARVVAVAEAIGYRPSALARNLRSGRTGLLGVVVTDITNPFWSRLAHAVEEAADQAGYSVVIGNTGGNGERERTVLEKLRSHKVEGILLASTGVHNHDYLQNFSSEGEPSLVTIDQYIEGTPFDFIGIDNRGAMQVLVEHLKRLGHSQIAFIGGEETHWTARERLAGFATAMEGADVLADEILHAFAGYQAARAYRTTVNLMTRKPPPTAIVGGTNIVTLRSLQALRDLGLNCPGDVSLAGIDELPWAYTTPTITSMIQPIDRIGTLAVEWLLERVHGKLKDTRRRQFMFECELQPGSSCRNLGRDSAISATVLHPIQP